MRPKLGPVGGAHLLDGPLQLADVGGGHLAALQRQLAGDEVERLDAVGALVDRQDAGVAVDAGRRRSPR